LQAILQQGGAGGDGAMGKTFLALHCSIDRILWTFFK
jgi:hypothetical protein